MTETDIDDSTINELQCILYQRCHIWKYNALDANRKILRDEIKLDRLTIDELAKEGIFRTLNDEDLRHVKLKKWNGVMNILAREKDDNATQDKEFIHSTWQFVLRSVRQLKSKRTEIVDACIKDGHIDLEHEITKYPAEVKEKFGDNKADSIILPIVKGNYKKTSCELLRTLRTRLESCKEVVYQLKGEKYDTVGATGGSYNALDEINATIRFITEAIKNTQSSRTESLEREICELKQIVKGFKIENIKEKEQNAELKRDLHQEREEHEKNIKRLIQNHEADIVLHKKDIGKHEQQISDLLSRPRIKTDKDLLPEKILMELAKRISSDDYKSLGIELGFEATDLDNIKADEKSTKNSTFALLVKWQRRLDEKKNKVQTLRGALIAAHRTDLASILDQLIKEERSKRDKKK